MKVVVDEVTKQEIDHLYWNTETKVADIADKYNLSKVIIPKLITPFKLENYQCKNCSSPMFYKTRSYKNENRSICFKSDCNHEDNWACECNTCIKEKQERSEKWERLKREVPSLITYKQRQLILSLIKSIPVEIDKKRLETIDSFNMDFANKFIKELIDITKRLATRNQMNCLKFKIKKLRDEHGINKFDSLDLNKLYTREFINKVFQAVGEIEHELDIYY